MLEYPIAVAGIFTKDDVPDPVCTICFFATTPASASEQEVEDYICSDIFPQLAQVIVNSGPDMVTDLIGQLSSVIASRFDISCQGYLNEVHLCGAPRGTEGK